jgi:hypothetical protein
MKRALMLIAIPVLLGLGCYAGPTRASVGVAYGNPPPIPAYYYTPAARPGYVWVDGYWGWVVDAWAWNPGYWVVERPGYYYTQGYWGGRTWHPGIWSPRGSTVVRDHRTYYAPGYAPGGGAAYYPSGRTQIVTPGPVSGGVRVAPAPAPRSVGVVRDHRH